MFSLHFIRKQLQLLGDLDPDLTETLLLAGDGLGVTDDTSMGNVDIGSGSVVELHVEGADDAGEGQVHLGKRHAVTDALPAALGEVADVLAQGDALLGSLDPALRLELPGVGVDVGVGVDEVGRLADRGLSRTVSVLKE